jgi:hypothetical protein
VLIGTRQVGKTTIARQIRARKKLGSLSGIIKEHYREAGIDEQELRWGIRWQAASDLRRKLCLQLYPELGLPLAEIARLVGVGTTGVAMAIKGLEVGNEAPLMI